MGVRIRQHVTKSALRQFQAEAHKMKFVDDDEEPPSWCQSIKSLIALYSTQFPSSTQATKQALLWILRFFYWHRTGVYSYMYIVPELLLRVNMNQSAFDFVRWSYEYLVLETHAEDVWIEPGTPFLSWQGCDRSDALVMEQLPIVYCYNLALVQFRLYLDLLHVQSLYTLLLGIQQGQGDLTKLQSGAVDVLRAVKGYLIADDLRTVHCTRDPSALLQQLHSFMLYHQQRRRLLWPALANHRPLLAQRRPVRNVVNSTAEANNAISICLSSWQRTDGALTFISNWVDEHSSRWFDHRIGPEFY